jgi:predicted phosphoribosyltransferase
VRFRNRRDAGKRLATRLKEYAGARDVIVLALPRGGVPVAFEIASALSAPLDVFLVRKLGVPGHAELAMGAIAERDVEVLNHELIEDLGIPPAQVRHVATRERLELERRGLLFREGREPLDLNGRTVILVDDGLATGATMEAAVAAVRRHTPARVLVAVPVGSREACVRLGRLADALVCLDIPDPFDAVGCWYEEFDQTSDEEVVRLLTSSGSAPLDAGKEH